MVEHAWHKWRRMMQAYRSQCPHPWPPGTDSCPHQMCHKLSYKKFALCLKLIEICRLHYRLQKGRGLKRLWRHIWGGARVAMKRDKGGYFSLKLCDVIYGWPLMKFYLKSKNNTSPVQSHLFSDTRNFTITSAFVSRHLQNLRNDLME